jgi:hypothetical protein
VEEEIFWVGMGSEQGLSKKPAEVAHLNKPMFFSLFIPSKNLAF